MNELRQALLPGEEIIFETRKHWMAPIRDSLIAILLVIGGLILWSLAPAGGEGLFGSIFGFLGTLMWWIGLAILVIGVAWFMWNIVAWLSANFGVSNQRVLCYEGLLRKHSSETLLSLGHRRQAHRPGVGRHVRLRRPDHPDRIRREGSDKFTTITARGRVPHRAPSGPDRARRRRPGRRESRPPRPSRPPQRQAAVDAAPAIPPTPLGPTSES